MKKIYKVSILVAIILLLIFLTTWTDSDTIRYILFIMIFITIILLREFANIM